MATRISEQTSQKSAGTFTGESTDSKQKSCAGIVKRIFPSQGQGSSGSVPPVPKEAAKPKASYLSPAVSVVARAILTPSPAPAPVPAPFEKCRTTVASKVIGGRTSPDASKSAQSPKPIQSPQSVEENLPSAANPPPLAGNPPIQKGGEIEEKKDEGDEGKEIYDDKDLSISEPEPISESRLQEVVQAFMPKDEQDYENFHSIFFSQYERGLTRVLDMESLRLLQGHKNIDDMHYYELDNCFSLFCNAFFGKMPMILGDSKLRSAPKKINGGSKEYWEYCFTVQNFGYLSKTGEHRYLPPDEYTHAQGKKILCQTPKNQGGILNTLHWTIAQNDCAILGAIRAYKSVYIKINGPIPKKILWEESQSRPRMLGRELFLLLCYGQYTSVKSRSAGSLGFVLNPSRPSSEESLKKGPELISYEAALVLLNKYKDWGSFKRYLNSKNIEVNDRK